jgi:radical SAM protein with 4Fe4S-binding SPASM domain
MSNTFCILPWIHVYANADGTVHPCCIGDYRYPLGNLQKESLEEVWNNENYKRLRRNMIEGKECKECTACYAAEQYGSSFRTHSNTQFEKYLPMKDITNTDGSLDEITLRYLDVRWSNICNLKCRSCSATYSSSWAKEDRKSV